MFFVFFRQIDFRRYITRKKISCISFDFEFSIEFVNAYLLINQNNQKITPRDRLSYVLDHNNPTPGTNENSILSLFYTRVFFSGYVTREQGEQVFNRLNRYYK